MGQAYGKQFQTRPDWENCLISIRIAAQPSPLYNDMMREKQDDSLWIFMELADLMIGSLNVVVSIIMVQFIYIQVWIRP